MSPAADERATAGQFVSLRLLSQRIMAFDESALVCFAPLHTPHIKLTSWPVVTSERLQHSSRFRSKLSGYSHRGDDVLDPQNITFEPWHRAFLCERLVLLASVACHAVFDLCRGQAGFLPDRAERTPPMG